jgi:photosystem II stability/assembly factor-like uncharacterized protein
MRPAMTQPILYALTALFAISNSMIAVQETYSQESPRQESAKTDDESGATEDAVQSESESLVVDEGSEEMGPKKPWNEAFQWRWLCPTVMSGRIVDIAVDPRNDAVIYAAAASGGLWKTENRGTTWTCVFDQYGTTSIGDVAVSPSQPDTVWIGTGEANNQRSSYWGDGVYKSTDGGATWTNMGLADSHHIGRIVVDPTNPKVVYVAALGHLYSSNEERGLFRTRNGGKTWEKVLYISPEVGVVDVVIDPRNPKNLVAASYERLRRAWNFDGNGPGSAIYRSQDGGDSWQKVTAGLPAGDIGRIGLSMYAKDPKIVYATVSNQNLVMDTVSLGELNKQEDGSLTLPVGLSVRFEDDQASITKVEENSAPARARIRERDTLLRIAGQSLSSEEELEAALKELRPGDQIRLSIQQGEETRDVEVTLPGSVAREVGGEVYRSEDGGRSWVKVNEESVGGSPAYYYGQIRVDPTDDQRLYMCGVPFLKSEDGGKTWSSDGARSVHVDHHAVWINPQNPQQILLGNDGGLHITHDGCKTWDQFFNLPAAQFYTVSVDMQQPYHVYGGLQDNGSFGGPNRSRNPSGVQVWDWYRVGGGDGFYVCIDPTNPEVIISESQFGFISRMHRSTGERRGIRPPQSDPNGLADRYNWNSPIVQSVHDSRVIYFGGNKLFRSRNLGDHWEVISPDLTRQDPTRIAGNVPHCTITTISESPSQPDTLLVGTDDGLLQWTRDGGKTWTRVSDALPFKPLSWWCSRVVLSRHQEGTAYATFTGYREDDFRPFIFKTTDHGESWVEIKGDLPNEPINVVAEDPVNQDVLYVGTELGVYATIDGGASWKSFGQGLPRIAVHDLVIHPRDRDLVVGTHAKGFYIVDDVTPLHEMSEQTHGEEVYLFPVQDGIKWQMVRGETTSGDRKFQSANPPNGVYVTYSLGKSVAEDAISLKVYNEANQEVAQLETSGDAGVHRVICSFDGNRGRGGRGGTGRGGRGGRPGPGFEPGRYYAVLTVDGEEYEQGFDVIADPILKTKTGPAR